MQCRCETEPGVIVPGVLVRAHRDPSPLLEPVEAPLHDIASPVAAAPVRDLIRSLRDRGRDAMPAQPAPVRLPGVALVRLFTIEGVDGA